MTQPTNGQGGTPIPPPDPNAPNEIGSSIKEVKKRIPKNQIKNLIMGAVVALFIIVFAGIATMMIIASTSTGSTNPLLALSIAGGIGLVLLFGFIGLALFIGSKVMKSAIKSDDSKVLAHHDDVGKDDKTTDKRPVKSSPPAVKLASVSAWRIFFFLVSLAVVGIFLLCLSLKEGPGAVYYNLTHPGTYTAPSPISPDALDVPPTPPVCEEVWKTEAQGVGDYSESGVRYIFIYPRPKPSTVCLQEWMTPPAQWSRWHKAFAHPRKGCYVWFQFFGPNTTVLGPYGPTNIPDFPNNMNHPRWRTATTCEFVYSQDG
jgi:hypothetical protein